MGDGCGGGASIVEARSPFVSQAELLGSAIRHHREERGISARDLSLRSGFSESYVGKVESGQLQPSLRAFGQLVVALELNSAEVFFLVIHEGRRALGG
jgi:transcriptional regulator with XRE-family HTH domain